MIWFSTTVIMARGIRVGRNTADTYCGGLVSPDLTSSLEIYDARLSISHPSPLSHADPQS